MSTPLAEQPYSSNNPERHLFVVPDLPEDELLTELQEHLQTIMGDEAPSIMSYEAILEKDYRGPASKKIQVGGRMVVSIYFDTERKDPLVFKCDQYNPYFNPETLVKLGKTAEKNWHNGNGVRRDLF